MYISTRSIAVQFTVPMTVESFLKDITPAVKELEKELDEHATGRSVTVCLEGTVGMRDPEINGMPVYQIGLGQGYELDTVHLGHGVDNLENFRIPPAGVIGL